MMVISILLRPPPCLHRMQPRCGRLFCNLLLPVPCTFLEAKEICDTVDGREYTILGQLGGVAGPGELWETFTRGAEVSIRMDGGK